jgi:transcriptional regulator with XRE-family HTH domain
MKTQIDLKQLLKKGHISDEIGLERAMILDRKLRLLVKENPELVIERNQLRAIIKDYENKNWSNDSLISEEKIQESDFAERIAEQEWQFLEHRKKVIKDKITEQGINQQDLGILLGHSKSYISELMNGISPFNNRDLIIIHHLFRIKLEDLIPTIIPQKDRNKIKASLLKINKPSLKLAKEDLLLKQEFLKSEEDIKAERVVNYSDFKEKLQLKYNL